MAFSPLCSVGLVAYDSLKDLTVVEPMGIIVQEMDPLNLLHMRGYVTSLRCRRLIQNPQQLSSRIEETTTQSDMRGRQRMKELITLQLIFQMAGGKEGQEIFADATADVTRRNFFATKHYKSFLKVIIFQALLRCDRPEDQVRN